MTLAERLYHTALLTLAAVVAVVQVVMVSGCGEAVPVAAKQPWFACGKVCNWDGLCVACDDTGSEPHNGIMRCDCTKADRYLDGLDDEATTPEEVAL